MSGLDNINEYIEQIREGDRKTLSRALTLVESTNKEHREQAQKIIEACVPYSGNSIRIGITGSPGAGKSTFIEAIGNYVITKGKKVAVLTVDPSSSKSKGSILGDKTRMETLANHENAFIRPSPSAGTFGGVARKTREMILLCEAAGYDTIFVETVGVGQSETDVHSMVDFFLLLMLAGAGDELQGIKRGIVEMADLLVINKTDINNKTLIRKSRLEYKSALRLYPNAESGWKPKVVNASALKKEGIDEIWSLIEEYLAMVKANGYFNQNRNRQARHWMIEAINYRLKDDLYNHPEVKKELSKMEKQVEKGEISSTKAAEKVLDIYHK